jgi:hypothetical protein
MPIRATIEEPSRQFFSRAHPFDASRDPASSSEALLRRIIIRSWSKGALMERDGGGIQAVKAARNQSLCREVNERIEALAETVGDLQLICECASLECQEILSLSVAEYEQIRSSPVRFPIALGHDVPEFENVVLLHDRYAVVQKRGQAAEVSVKLDPRSRQS